MDDSDVEDIFDHNLRQIDSVLASAEMPIVNRVLEAAMIFANECVVEVRGDTKEDMLVKPWFAAIYRDVYRWYEARYGPKIHPPSKMLEGVILYSGDVFAVDVPATIWERNDDGETGWLHFPLGIHEAEDPLSWIRDMPRASALNGEVRAQLRSEIGDIAAILRSTRCHLMTVKPPDEIADGLRNAVAANSASAARSMLDRDRNQAVWASHQAVEQALKLLLRCTGNAPPKHHDLRDLAARARARTGLTLPAEDLDALPNADRVIRIRAREQDVGSVADAYRVYRAALRLVDQIASAVPRRIVMADTRFLIKKLPWIKQASG